MRTYHFSHSRSPFKSEIKSRSCSTQKISRCSPYENCSHSIIVKYMKDNQPLISNETQEYVLQAHPEERGQRYQCTLPMFDPPQEPYLSCFQSIRDKAVLANKMTKLENDFLRKQKKKRIDKNIPLNAPKPMKKRTMCNVCFKDYSAQGYFDHIESQEHKSCYYNNDYSEKIQQLEIQLKEFNLHKEISQNSHLEASTSYSKSSSDQQLNSTSAKDDTDDNTNTNQNQYFGLTAWSQELSQYSYNYYYKNKENKNNSHIFHSNRIDSGLLMKTIDFFSKTIPTKIKQIFTTKKRNDNNQQQHHKQNGKKRTSSQISQPNSQQSEFSNLIDEEEQQYFEQLKGKELKNQHKYNIFGEHSNFIYKEDVNIQMASSQKNQKQKQNQKKPNIENGFIQESRIKLNLKEQESPPFIVKEIAKERNNNLFANQLTKSSIEQINQVQQDEFEECVIKELPVGLLENVENVNQFSKRKESLENTKQKQNRFNTTEYTDSKISKVRSNSSIHFTARSTSCESGSKETLPSHINTPQKNNPSPIQSASSKWQNTLRAIIIFTITSGIKLGIDLSIKELVSFFSLGRLKKIIVSE